MKIWALFLILLTLIPCDSLSAEEIALTLDEALAIALRDNRDILLKSEDVKKAKAEIAESQSSLLPSLDFTATETNTRGYYSKDLTQTTTQTTVKQYLYKGGETINTIQYNEFRLTVAEAILDKTKLETALTVKKTFYTLLLATEFADLNNGLLDNTLEHLDSLRLRYQNGQASESDLLKVESSLASVGETYQTSLSQVASSQMLLNNLLYLDMTLQIKPQGQFNYEPKELAYDEALVKAMKNRPEIKQYEAQVNAEQRAIAIAKAESRPTIYASWDYYNRSHPAASSVRGWNDYNVLGLTFSWPLFDGGATKAKVEQAIIDLKEAKLTQEKLIKDIAQEVKSAYLDLKNALAKIKSTQAQADLSKDTLVVSAEKYNAGIASLLDLHDAALGYRIALFNQKESIYDYIVAKAEFDKVTGGL